MNTLFLKIATRYLVKNRLYSFLNIAGLAVGIASFLLIMIYVNYEQGYDRFKGSELVYRAYLDYKEGATFEAGDTQTSNLTGPSLKNIFPEITEQVRFFWFDKAAFVYKGSIVEAEKGSMADASYFDVFPYKLLQGNAHDALHAPNSMVLTESIAKKIFGSEEAVGKTIKFLWSGTELMVTITGVREDVKGNTHFENNFLLSFNTYKTWEVFKGQARELNWDLNMYYTYFKVAEHTDYTALQQKVMAHNLGNDDAANERHNIEPIEDIHLHSNKPYEIQANGSITRVRFLSAIAFVILVLSWLNYINLATTKSLERAKEIGVRKVAGAQKRQLVVQGVLESMLLNIVSLGIGLGIVLLTLPLYRSLTGKMIGAEFLLDPFIFGVLIIVFLGMAVAALYPAFLLSGYAPSAALKGEIKNSPVGSGIRKGLVMTQFVATIILISGTLIVSKQLNFLSNKSPGVDLAQVISLQGEIVDQGTDSLRTANFAALKSELKKYPFITEVVGSQTYPGDNYDNLGSFVGITYPDGTTEEQINYYNYGVNEGYFDLVGIDFIAGSDFLPTQSGSSDQIIINRKVAALMGFTNMENVLGKTVKFWGEEKVVQGVIENYHHFGLKNQIQPIIVIHRNTKYNLLVKLNEQALTGNALGEALTSIRKTWDAVFPQSTFNYTFLDQKFEAQYKEDRAFGSAFQFFTILAIIIASLGLFGLTSYTCIQRQKEIGVRKVNGATVAQVVTLLNKDFIKWVGIAFLIAVPITRYIMSQWLEGFAYKTTMSWWVFALSGLIALFVAMLTVSWQSLKAAVANPVDALRNQ